ncbi:MAG: AAA family ATPase [Propionibacteriaceae bacterium]|nr:AAA family ATPase [Propionibacteriaceae bacterium]
MRAKTVLSLDTPQVFNLVAADPEAVLQVPRPVFIDEWQLVPNVWNTIRHAVDDGADPGSFILAGSFAPAKDARLHSGAGRFVRLTMRPMNLCERGFSEGTISLKSLLDGERPTVEGGTELQKQALRFGVPVRCLAG